MTQSFTEPSKKLYESVRNLDRALARPLRKKPLATLQVGQLLKQVEGFYHVAGQQSDLAEEVDAGFRKLLAAGCRLSTDLNEAVLSQLMEQAQNQDAQIALLSRLLIRQLMARVQTGQLLKKVQTLRQKGLETAETIGLGVII